MAMPVPLSGLDAAFLYLETPQMPMHVGALHTFALPPGYRGDFAADVRKHLAARAHLAPPLGRQLLELPMNLATPSWVTAKVDFNEHVVAVKLPRLARGSSGMAETQALVSKLHPVLLERDRPLWRFHVISGFKPLADGSPVFGLYTKLHHAAVDGQAAVALAQAILDLQAEGREVHAPAVLPKSAHQSLAQQLGGALAHQMRQVADLARALPGTAKAVGGALGQKAASTALDGATGARDAMLDAATRAAKKWIDGLDLRDAKGRVLKGKARNLTIAPRTPFNATVGRKRAFATVSLPLVELKLQRLAFDATLNDVVLAICSGALRSYLKAHHELPKESLIAAVPVSLRVSGDTRATNQASMSVVSLGTHLATPARRMAHVKEATAAMKTALLSLKSVLPTDFPTLGVPWLLTGLTALYGRSKLADRIPPLANVVISNVPGPAVPLYLAGGRMLTNHPSSIVVHGVALNITVQTYAGALDFGLMACAKAMPDVAAFADAIHTSHAELLALARRKIAKPSTKSRPVARVSAASGTRR